MKTWIAGMDAAIDRIEPNTILLYGGAVDYDFADIKVVEYKNKVTEKWGNRV